MLASTRVIGWTAVLIAVHTTTVWGDGLRKGDRVVTTADASLKRGTTTLGTVPAGTDLTVQQVKGAWIAVQSAVRGRAGRVSGWMHSKHVRVATSSSSRSVSGSRDEEPSADVPPTEDLFDKAGLISFDFAPRHATVRIFGDDLFSIYLVKRHGDGLKLSSQLPDTKGEMVFRGLLWRTPTLDTSHRRTDNLVVNGYVWTERLEKSGTIDLATPGKISELPSFDFDSFIKSKQVIQFANGYAVNLFGAIVYGGNIEQAGSRRSYENADGLKLPGRLLMQEHDSEGKPVIRETIIP